MNTQYILFYVAFFVYSTTDSPKPRFIENPIINSVGKVKWLSLMFNHAKYMQLLVYPHTMSADYCHNCIPLVKSL